MQLEEKGTLTIGKPQKGFMDERERTEEKKVRQLRKEEFSYLSDLHDNEQSKTET